MFKFIFSVFAGLFAATSAMAGAVAYVAPVVPEMVTEETGSMGGSGMWLIPLLAIALIFLVMNGSQPAEEVIIEEVLP